MECPQAISEHGLRHAPSAILARSEQGLKPGAAARPARGDGRKPLRKVGRWRKLRLRAGVAVSRCAGAAAEAAALAAANGRAGDATKERGREGRAGHD